MSYDAKNREQHLRQGKKEQPSKGVKMAIFAKRIVSKEPIANMTVVGDTMLKHGKLVRDPCSDQRSLLDS